ncbi:FAD-dependent monooxygenase [Legionella sp. 16cNR16C]|uniref:FAD-dependent monooxygenase n=1 Tax=Legionella sp. 16cNR16C TaxID=2905656 RepID=UPI001E4E6440|nr:FAD-dependent monooxygenase [Legionella sp. 16cNR16C]MCE3044701.1 FAD-dependent monooxygenase [Legionella sp. 16cNR16C]
MTKNAYIMGMGPAGLAAALSLLSKGYSVHLIDSRREDQLFSRSQGVVLQEQTITDFFNLSSLKNKAYFLNQRDFRCQLIAPQELPELNEEERLDLAFFELIEKERTVIAISDLQRYQYEKLQFIYAKRAYSFKRNTIQFSDDQQLVFHKGDTQVIEARGKEQELILEIDGKQQSVHFDLLVDASGKTAKSYTQIWNRQNPEFAISYEPIENPEYNAFGIISLAIENAPFEMMRTPVMTPFDSSIILSPEQISELKSLGWKLDRSPVFFIKYSKQSETVYATGEVPEEILQSKDTGELKKWFDRIIQLLMKNEKFKTRALNLSSVFKMNLEIASHHAMGLPQGGFYCLIGDAFMPANFLLGCGIENALEDAAELFDGVENQFAEQEEYRKERAEDYIDCLQHFKSLVDHREKISLIQYELQQLSTQTPP